MIRKAIITVLTLATVASACLWVVSVVHWTLLDISQYTGYWSIVPTGREAILSIRNGRAEMVEDIPSQLWVHMRRSTLPMPRRRRLSIPLWAPVLLFGAYPLYSLIRSPRGVPDVSPLCQRPRTTCHGDQVALDCARSKVPREKVPQSESSIQSRRPAARSSARRARLHRHFAVGKSDSDYRARMWWWLATRWPLLGAPGG